MINAALLETVSDESDARPPVFWALDPRLPRIAAQAAVEFDWLVQQKTGNNLPHVSREAINALHLLLSESTGTAQPGGPDNKGFVDTLGLNLFAKAYNASHTGHPVRTRDELDTAMRQLVDSLYRAGENNELAENILADMRDFCAKLSDYGSAYRKMIYGSRQEHPYRK
ncbi:MAG: hypothetical protein B7X04_01530 [Parcubacteria group bacterium 21-54-25]|nr:MAG: hypothetical protein B7X04_01530 [Parcubacteria group bacterium 21-54-25]HQU07606.1 hypothetical protein [Candidatus Paceibacterota bacterium]